MAFTEFNDLLNNTFKIEPRLIENINSYKTAVTSLAHR